MRYSYAPGSAAAHDRAVAEYGGVVTSSAPATPWAILRPAQPYDLTTPGTPQGIRDLARAAATGGVWAARATFALAASPDGGEVVASLCLRLQADLPGRPRRAWAAYVRREREDGAVVWAPNGAALLDPEPPPPGMRLIGLLELRALLLGVPYVPPPPRPSPPRMMCQECDRVVPFTTSTWRPYSNHKCQVTSGNEGRS